MKGTLKAVTLAATLLTLGACSSMTTIAERDEYAQPKWYADCAQSGTEGWFWWEKEYAYACGAGESVFGQASEAEAYAFAMKGFAERINGHVNSKTEVKIVDDTKTSSTVVSHYVTDTTIREHLEVKKGVFKYSGKQYNFVRLKMPKEVFDTLIQEAKANNNKAQ